MSILADTLQDREGFSQTQGEGRMQEFWFYSLCILFLFHLQSQGLALVTLWLLV